MTESKPESKPELNPAPEDNPDGKGYAVYDRVLARYVGGVTPDKPSDKDAKAAAGDHAYRVVKV